MNTTKSKAPQARESIDRNIVRDRKTGHYLVTHLQKQDGKETNMNMSEKISVK